MISRIGARIAALRKQQTKYIRDYHQQKLAKQIKKNVIFKQTYRSNSHAVQVPLISSISSRQLGKPLFIIQAGNVFSKSYSTEYAETTIFPIICQNYHQ